MDKHRRIHRKPLYFEIFLPELFKFPDPCPFAEKFKIPASAQKIVVIVSLLLSFLPDAFVPGSPRQDLHIRQIDKTGRNPLPIRLLQSRQLGRAVQKRIITLVIFLFLTDQACLILIGVIQSQRRLRLLMGEHRNQVLRVLRPLNQNAVRPVSLYGLLQVKRTDRTVVAHWEIQHSSGQIVLRPRSNDVLYLRYFLAA